MSALPYVGNHLAKSKTTGLKPLGVLVCGCWLGVFVCWSFAGWVSLFALFAVGAFAGRLLVGCLCLLLVRLRPAIRYQSELAYYVVCPPAALELTRVQALRQWLLQEVAAPA